MSDKFTIKFKGILDHAATKKAIEQDISKMEKYLKPKKSSLGSTKDIVKNNLSDKKKELNRQSKFESLRERVEKYRLSQTKKLIKQGMGFEKARKEAFKRSLMSDRDKRRLEYKELAKESKAKSKTLVSSKKEGLIGKIAIGSAMGNVLSNAIGKVLGGALGFAKKSIEEASKTNKMKLLNNAVFTKKEQEELFGAIGNIKGFERNLEKEDFLRKASTLKGSLMELGFTDTDILKKAVEFSAKLKASGAVSSNSAAVAAVDELLRGTGDSLFELMKQFKGIGKDYLEMDKLNWQQDSQQNLESRKNMLIKMLKDFTSLNIMQAADTYDSIQNNIATAEETLAKLTTSFVNPLLNAINGITEYLNNFSVEKNIINPLIRGMKDIFAFLNPSKLVPNITSGVVNMANTTWNLITGSDNKTGGPPQDNNISGP
ncbi:DUF759 family protein [Borreliella burgdorferi]|uniref:DUF759 family protein n=1 Tax=Borreliella burgdorferi TaxID=139 RepID=UPI001E3C2BA8|nr:DUF759 family protein [Borreliella burgdorferi]